MERFENGNEKKEIKTGAASLTEAELAALRDAADTEDEALDGSDDDGGADGTGAGNAVSGGPVVREVPATAEDAGRRLDVFLAERLEESRSRMQGILGQGKVLKGGRPMKANYKVKAGDSFLVELPDPEPEEPQPEDIPLDILYEDEDLLVLNKARGMVVHPAPGHMHGTLVNALLHHCGEHLSTVGGAFRPGIVHRLDKDTSGVMMVAKNDAAHLSLARQIQSKTARRSYLAVVRGNVKEDSGRIETLLARDKRERKRMAVVEEDGRDAITGYTVLERFGRFTLVRCDLETGRTHQIRVHMQYLGNPVVGDPKYSPQKEPFAIKGQALHSHTLDLLHPRTGEALHFEAPVPADMAKIITRLHHHQF